MPTFPTPTPIDLAINLQVGAIVVVASDRADTVVTVSATSATKAADQRGADETDVSFDGKRLTITGPRPRVSWIGPSESVDVRVEVPTGSRFTAELSLGELSTEGRLGATRIKSSMGYVDLDTTADLWLRAAHGNATVRSAEGGVEITADRGQIHVGSVAGDAVLRSSHGAVTVGEVGGSLDAKLSYGNLTVSKAHGSVAAKSAYGRIEVDDVSRGTVDVESGYGQISIAVRPGVAAWLDLSSKKGRVRNHLDGDAAPQESEQTVAVRARTQAGDISIHRARSTTAAH
jgi:DUF4097 and DUF4098 domain-containing protein YvlB